MRRSSMAAAQRRGCSAVPSGAQHSHHVLHRVASLFDNTACLTPADVMMNAMQAGMTLTPRVLFTLLALVRLLR